MKTGVIFAFLVMIICSSALAEMVDLKDQIGICLMYDFQETVQLDRVERSVDSVESIGRDYILGSINYDSRLKVSFYLGMDGKAVVYHPKEVNPALMFYPWGTTADLKHNNNLYTTLTKLARIANLIIDSEPDDYCYAPLEGSKNLFVCSNDIKLKLRGNLSIERVYAYLSSNGPIPGDTTPAVMINEIGLAYADFELLGESKNVSSYLSAKYHGDLTRFFLKARTQEFLVKPNGHLCLLIFCSE